MLSNTVRTGGTIHISTHETHGVTADGASRGRGESGVGARGGGVSHRGRLLELDIDTASRGVSDGPLGLVVEAIVPQAVAGRSHGGEMGAGARATHPSDRRTWPRSTRRTMEGGIAWMWRTGEGSACVCERLRANAERFLRAKQGMCVRKGNVFAF